MPYITDSRGVGVLISDEQALDEAERLIIDVELAEQRANAGYLSDRDAGRMRLAFEEAQNLLAQTGHLDEPEPTDLAKFYQPGAAEQELAERQQVRREAATITAAGGLLGRAWSDKAMRAVDSAKTTPEPGVERKDVVRLRRIAGGWLLTGKGADLRFSSYDLAEAAAKRRAGWT